MLNFSKARHKKSRVVSPALNNNKILITERGSSFGYNNLVSDFRSLDIIHSIAK